MVKHSPYPDETELAQRSAGGDLQAFRQLYDVYVRRIHAQVGRLLGWSEETEDVVQEVFVQVYRALPSFRGDSSFGTWLFRITYNVAVSHLRRRADQPVNLAGLRGLATGVTQPNFEARRQVRALHAALAELPVEAREAFVLYELEGLSLREIAEVKETSLNTIAARVRRARERLRRLLGREDKARRKAND